MSDTREKVREFVKRAARLRTLDDEEPIIETGLINSLLLAQLMSLVEKEIAAPLDREDIVTDNFRSVAAIARFIDAKQSAGAC